MHQVCFHCWSLCQNIIVIKHNQGPKSAANLKTFGWLAALPVIHCRHFRHSSLPYDVTIWTSKFSSQVPNPPSSWTSQLLMTFYCTMVSDAPWRMQPPSFKKIVIGFIAKEKIEILPNWSPGLVKGFRALVTKLEVVGAPGNASAALLMVKRPPNDVNRLCHI